MYMLTLRFGSLYLLGHSNLPSFSKVYFTLYIIPSGNKSNMSKGNECLLGGYAKGEGKLNNLIYCSKITKKREFQLAPKGLLLSMSSDMLTLSLVPATVRL